MENTDKKKITIQATIVAPVDKVWDMWTNPKHIVCWNNASEDWTTTRAENDLREGGRFLSRMEAKDGSMGFDFSGKYTAVKPYKLIEYTIDDERTVEISFSTDKVITHITETFEAESVNSPELQKAGWQSILDNFKSYVEKTK
jgi:uncharacterized protein YndB with AHSA1/START domain